MATVIQLEEAREKARAAHLAASQEERDTISDEMNLLYDQQRKGRVGPEVDSKIAELRARRDLLRDSTEVAELERKLSAARQKERAEALAREMSEIAELCGGLTIEEMELAERESRGNARVALRRADAIARHIGERRASAAADETVAPMSREQRAKLKAAIERADQEDEQAAG